MRYKILFCWLLPISAFAEDPMHEFRGTYTVNSDVVVMREILTNPVFGTDIWHAYVFAPRYKFKRNGKEFQLIDPSFAQTRGTFQLKEVKDDTVVVYEGTGTVDYVFLRDNPSRVELAISVSGDEKQTNVTITLKAWNDSWAVRAGSTVFGSVIDHYADKRFTSHLNDLSIFANYMLQKPQQAESELVRHGGTIPPSIMQYALKR